MGVRLAYLIATAAIVIGLVWLTGGGWS